MRSRKVPPALEELRRTSRWAGGHEQIPRLSRLRGLRNDGGGEQSSVWRMRAWVYKVNSRGKGGTRDWHFDQFFRYRGRRDYEMGGEKRIRSPSSWACLRRVRRGDLFICYQTDERKIYGLARAAGRGYESWPGSGRLDSIAFRPGGLRLRNPVGVGHPQAREVFSHVRAFTVPSRGTIHAVAADELRAVQRQLVESNSHQRRAILKFAKQRWARC